VLAALAEQAGCEILGMEVVPDDFALIEDRLHHFVVIHREAPGLAEAMRAESARHTPLGILTRGIAGIAESTLIVNFPGSPKAIEQLFPVIAPVLKHAVQTLRGDSSHGNHRPGG
jgi:molybdopterin adenylyltransferase